MLDKMEICDIEDKAKQERGKYGLGAQSAIGNNIFDIIEKQYSANLILYPIKSKKIAGFTRKINEVKQIFINTSFSKSYQLFVAAHELYHLIEFENRNFQNIILCNKSDISENIDEELLDKEEMKANYFAAAFLLPEEVIKKRFRNIKEMKLEDIILESLKIEYEFKVPYKTIVRRILETEIVKKGALYNKLIEEENELDRYYKMLDSDINEEIRELEKINERKYHTLNVPKIAVENYNDNLITISKLENIMEKYDKSLQDFNIEKESVQPLNLDFSNFEDEDE